MASKKRSSPSSSWTHVFVGICDDASLDMCVFDANSTDDGKDILEYFDVKIPQKAVELAEKEGEKKDKKIFCQKISFYIQFFQWLLDDAGEENKNEYEDLLTHFPKLCTLKKGSWSNKKEDLPDLHPFPSHSSLTMCVYYCWC